MSGKEVPKKKEKTVSEPIRKGNATLVIRLEDAQWDEIVDLIKYLQRNEMGRVVEVYIGDQVFDA